MTTFRKSLAFSSCPLACTVVARLGPHRMPVGRFTLDASMASLTCSSAIPRAASACGSSWIRTAYFWAPNTDTCATPFTIEMLCASVFSAYSSSCDSGNSFDVSARYWIGWSAGFTF